MMRTLFRVILLSALAAHLNACRGGPSGPDQQLVNVAGVWDVEFSGTVQGRGTAQNDSLVMELTQSGPNVTGSMCSGLCVPGDFPILEVSGIVNGESLVYAARASLGPDCDVVVEAEVTLNAAGTVFTGSQTQSTCEGTAVGSVSARKR